MTSTPDRLRTVAVVLAGGTGSRVGLGLPKQLLKVAGRSIIEHTVEALHACEDVDELLVVMTPDFVEDARRLLRPETLPKLRSVLAGGRDRNESTRIALAALGEQECNVLFHDAVRPLLSQRVVRDCVAALGTAEAVDVAIPSADTIVRVDAEDHIVEIPDRSVLRRGQTPQGFRLSVIRRAYELAARDPDFSATDDCAVVLRYLPEVPIRVLRGEEQNMKVTYPVDLFVVDKLFQLSSGLAAPRTADEHAALLAGKVLVVLGGSYGIGADIVRLAEQAGCRVFSCSRSTTGTDVEDPATVIAALREAHEQAGRIDAVVLTAAQLAKGPLADMTDEQVLQQVKVNYLAPVHVARAAHRYLSETGGHLLLFTSSSYTRGRADYVMYSSTKAAVVNLTQALADEWSPEGISVNVLNPERTRTPMRVQAFGHEPEDSLLASEAVASTALDVLVSGLTGHVIDVRRPAAPAAPQGADAPDIARRATQLQEAEFVAQALAELQADVEGGEQETGR